MKLIIIAAFNRNRIIGKDGKVPWHIPEDLARFKQLTLGHPVIMGRKTFESLPSPLQQRRNIVITSRMIPGIETFTSLDSALQVLQKETQVFIIGGEKMFREALPLADELYLTLVHSTDEGDALFPEYEGFAAKNFDLIKTEHRDSFDFVHYRRKPSAYS